MAQHVSPHGRILLEQREGVVLHAYRDSVGVLTIGVGHTGRMSPPAVTAGMVVTRDQADAYLTADLAEAERAIAAIGVPLTQNQFDALASLYHNIGGEHFAGSTVKRRLALKDYDGAADAFLFWETPAVLKARRVAERAQFLAPDSATDHAAHLPEITPAEPAPALPSSAVPSGAPAAPPSTATRFLSTGEIIVELTKILPSLALIFGSVTQSSTLVSTIPQIASEIPDAVAIFDMMMKDVGALIADVKAGKYGDAMNVDANKVFADLHGILSRTVDIVDRIVGMLGTVLHIPALGTIKTVLDMVDGALKPTAAPAVAAAATA